MENKLNIQITVTDEQMSSLIRGNLENLPDDKLQEILSDALREFLKTQNGQNMFYTKQFYDSNPKPSPLLIKMVENAISKDLLKPCANELIEIIKNNYENLIRDTMIAVFSNVFLTQIEQRHIQDSLAQLINKIENLEAKQ